MSATRTPTRRRTARLAVATTLAIVALIGTAVWNPVPGALVAPVAAADPSATPAPTAEATPAPVPASATPIPSDPASPSSAVSPIPASPLPAAATPEPTSSPTALPSAVASGLAPPDASPSAQPLLRYALSSGQQPGTPIGQPIPLYRLVVPSAPLASGSTSPHAGDTLAGADCASCHSAHTARGANLVATTPETTLCYRCHGAGSALDVEADFAGLPANDEATDAYYSHPVTDASSALHASQPDEFGGISNRHAVCADCHNPHDATAARPQQSTTGWTASGAIGGARGVAVTNAGPATTPEYRLVRAGRGLTYEYELCLTCHSGWTQLPARAAANPSWWALDKGAELNPANRSYHPVEAAGRNQTAQMAASLAGTSPFKAWTLSIDATIRCTSCHGDPSTVNQAPAASPKQPAADVEEPSHGSPNRGLLIAPYRDRALKPAGEAYASGDFALCYLCHAERPFVDPNPTADAPDTLFPLHGAHLTAYTGTAGGGLSIDRAGDGAGFAVCAECHFRIHSTAAAYAPGDMAAKLRTSGNVSLVGFAPNVTGAGGLPPTWTPPAADGAGSCTLTCHGHEHTAAGYTTAPGAGFTASPTSGALGSGGLTVQFTDASRYADTAGATWSWDFGDGETASEREPIHTYLAPGTYTVRLTVTRTGATPLASTLTRSDYIVVTQ